MGRVQHGRRMGSRLLDAADEGDGGAPRSSAKREETVFRVQVQAPDDPESFKLSTQMVSGEYATRYLERLGVKPSKSTLELVHKSVPLSDSCMKTTLRSKGHVNDQLLITVPAVNHNFRVPQVISSISVAQLGYNNQEDKGLQQAKEERPAGRSGSSSSLQPKHSSADSGSTHPEAGSSKAAAPTGSAFKNFAQGFLHPFNLDMNMARQHVERIKIKHTKEEASSSAREFGSRAASPAFTDDSRTFEEGGSLHEELAEELVQELVVTPELVLTMIAPLEAALLDWFKAQAAETLKDRLSKDEFRAAIELLSDDTTIRFFATSINFMHEEFIKTSSLYDSSLESKMVHTSSLSRQSSMARFKSPGSALLGSRGAAPGTMSRPMALQEFDLGYRLFVKDKMADLRQEQRAAGPGPSMRHRAGQLHTPGGASIFQPPLGSSRGSWLEPPTPGPSGAPTPGAGDYQHVPPVRARSLAAAASSNRVTFNQGPDQGYSGSLPGSALEGSFAVGSRSHIHHQSSLSPSLDDLDLRDLDGNVLLADTSPAVRRSIRHLSAVESLSAASLARSVLEGLGASDMDCLQQTRLFALQKEFAALYKKQRQARAGLFFTLPIFLLFLRLTVNLLFSSLYPLWSQTRDGIDTLEQMDNTLVQMLDPAGYLQKNLSLIQSSPAAVSILAKYPHKSHEPERTHFSDISPLLRAALPEPSSAAARRMLAAARKAIAGKGSRAAVRTELTATQRDQLYQDARRMAHTKDAQHAKLGEPVQHTTRDSWIPKLDS